MSSSLLTTSEANDLYAGLTSPAIRPVRMRPIQYFLEANGTIKEMDTNNRPEFLFGIVVGISLWANKKDEHYMGVQCRTGENTGFQLNLKCNNLQYCARQAVAKLACINRLSSKDTAVTMITEQLPGRKVGGETLKAIAFDVFIDQNPVADERLACEKDPVAFMDALNFLRSELGLAALDRFTLCEDRGFDCDVDPVA